MCIREVILNKRHGSVSMLMYVLNDDSYVNSLLCGTCSLFLSLSLRCAHSLSQPSKRARVCVVVCRFMQSLNDGCLSLGCSLAHKS